MTWIKGDREMPSPNKRNGTPAMDRMKQAILNAMKEDADKLDGIQLLAVLSNIVGTTLAFQDRNRYSVDQYMAIIDANIAEGNRAAIEAARAIVPKGSC
jgi:hypothetical protein